MTLTFDLLVQQSSPDHDASNMYQVCIKSGNLGSITFYLLHRKHTHIQTDRQTDRQTDSW